jgi:glycosyltransferase involved in cell wall biosynthesis
MKTTLLIPTLNEIDGMRAIMPQIQRDWVDQILIVDGGSTDGTVEYAKEHGYAIYTQREPGVRQAYMTILPYIEGDVLITFSPDGNSIPQLIPRLVAKMKEGYDMVIVLHGGHYTDVMVILRAYRTQLIYDLELDQDKSHQTQERLFGCRISWEPLLSVRAAKRKLKVAEIPGDEPPRIGGERKLRIWRWGAAYYSQFLREAFVWR